MTTSGAEGKEGAAPAPGAAAKLGRLLDGFLTTQLLYVAAKLDVAKILRDGPKSGAEIAETAGVDAGALTRVLRGLAAEGVLWETNDGRFELSAVGERLEVLRGAALVRGDLYFLSAAGLLDAVRFGGVSFEGVYGETFFEHLGNDPVHEEEFNASMAGRAEQEASDIIAAYDFSGIRTIVDVGGGRGVLLAAILRAAPSCSGVLVDRPAAVPEARAYLEAGGLGDRSDCRSADFFTSVPQGADAYVLSRVLHDWDDADAERILATCREAMPPTSRLLIVEAILPEHARDSPAATRMDLHMMLLFGARERAAAEFEALLSHTGFRLDRVIPTASPAGLGVIEASPQGAGEPTPA